MKKQFLFFAFLLCSFVANAQNINRDISISIPSLSTGNNDEVCLNIFNGSSCNIAIDFIIVYTTSSELIYLEYGDGSITYSTWYHKDPICILRRRIYDDGGMDC